MSTNPELLNSREMAVYCGADAEWLAGNCPGCETPFAACSYSQNPALGRGDCCADCAHPGIQAQ